MNVYVSFDGDSIGQKVGRARLADDADGVRRISQGINLGNEVWRSWVLSVGGSVVEIGGDEGSIEVPADRLDELPRVREQYSDAVGASVSVGVGVKLSEADKALLYAKATGKDKICFWAPQVDEYVRDLAQRQQRSEEGKLFDEYLGKSEDPRHLKYSADRDPFAALAGDALARVHVRPLGVVGGMDAWLVDGTTIRDDVDVDFCEGGNPARYAYVPTGEVWVDQCLPPPDQAATLVHELVEHRLMEDQGLSYDDAHDQANVREQKFRAQQRDATALDVGAVRRFLDGSGYDGLAKAGVAMNAGAFAGHARPSAPMVQKPQGGQGDHSEAHDVYQLVDDQSRPAPQEMTHAADDFEEQFHQAAQQQAQVDQQQQAQAAQHRDGLMAQVVQVLQTVKQLTPVLEQMRQASPQTYQAVTQMAQVVIQLARELRPQPQAAPVFKSEEHAPGSRSLDADVVGQAAVHLDPEDSPPKDEIDQVLGKMALVWNDQKKPMIVYRVQNEHGEGPYDQDSAQNGFPQTKISLPGTGDPYRQPLPDDDFSPEDMNEFHGQDPETGNGSGYYSFAFEHPNDAVSWFGRGGLQKLYEHGYRVKEIPASKVYRSGSGRQVFFEHHPAFDHDPAKARDARGFDHPTPPPKRPRAKKTMAKAAIPSNVHHLNLPVGSQLDTADQGTREAGKTKIQHGNGKQSWVSVRAGQILSPDGHAVSSRSPEAK